MFSFKKKILFAIAVVVMAAATSIDGGGGSRSGKPRVMPTPVPGYEAAEEMQEDAKENLLYKEENPREGATTVAEAAKLAEVISDTANVVACSIAEQMPMKEMASLTIAAAPEEEKESTGWQLPVVTELSERRRTVNTAVSGPALLLSDKNLKMWESLKKNLDDDDIPEPDLEKGNSVCSAAAEYLGYPYSNGHKKRFSDYADCSSLAYRAYEAIGIEIGYHGTVTAASEAKRCVKENWVVSYGYDEGMMVPGDLVFWTTDEPEHEGRYLDIYHVGIYAGKGKLIEASSSEGEVVVRNAWGKDSIIIVARPQAETGNRKIPKK